MKRDRKNKTRVADALDLVNLLAKATNGTLESPAEVLQAIGVAWQAINASNATAARASRADGKGRPSAHASDAPAADLADALLLVQSRWLEEGLLGTVLDELERTGKETALTTLCVGGGMGTATIIERV